MEGLPSATPSTFVTCMVIARLQFLGYMHATKLY